MRALCTTPDRNLEVREIAAPTQPAAEHVLVRVEACAINPGDITFLKRPSMLGPAPRRGEVWGASGAGTVTQLGPGVPASYLGQKGALYRSHAGTENTIGTWCEIAEMHVSTLAILPDAAAAVDYCGSLVNLITPYAFMAQAREEGHAGILITAGNSATGIAMLGLA
jgi:NADPH2:quinone reductase